MSARLVASESLAAHWQAATTTPPRFDAWPDTTLAELVAAALDDAGLDESSATPPIHVHVAADRRELLSPEVLVGRCASIEVAEFPLVAALARAREDLAGHASHASHASHVMAVAVAIVAIAQVGGRISVSGVALVVAGPAHRGPPLAIVRGLTHAPVPAGPSEPAIRAALQHTCAQADIEASSIALLDLDGDVGPLATTLQAFSTEFAEPRRSLPRCSLGLRHVDSAPAVRSGVLALLRSLLALAQRVLLPTRAEPELEGLDWLSGAEQVRPWMRGAEKTPRRACCFARGERTLACVVLEEAVGVAPLRLAGLHSAELMVFGADSREALRTELAELAELLQRDPPPLGSLAARLAKRVAGRRHVHRAALVGRSVAELARKLARLATRLESPELTSVRSRSGSYYADLDAHPPGATAFCYPGQGSQYMRMAGELCVELPMLQAWFDRLDDTTAANEPCPATTLIAPPSIGLAEGQRRLIGDNLYDMESGAHVASVASLALTELLRAIGVSPSAAIGYSNGENSALIAAGIIELRDPNEPFAMMARLRGEAREADTLGHIPKGRSMAVNRAPRDRIDALLAREDQLYLALDNCPSQVVLFADEDTIARVRGELDQTGALCLMLPFDRAYHTPSFRTKAAHIREIYDLFQIRAGDIPLYSCVHASPFPAEPDAIRDLAAEQWATTVEFRKTIERMYADGVRQFVEVGVGGRLSSFVADTLGERPHLAVACTIESQPEYEHLLKTLAQLHVHGLDLDLGPLDRGSREPAPTRHVAIEPDAQPDDATPDDAAPDDVDVAEARTSTLDSVPSASASAVESGSGPDAGEAALRHFELMREFVRQQSRLQIELQDRLGGAIDDVVPEAAPPPRSARWPWPMLDTVESSSADEIIARRRLDPARDRILIDHALGKPGAPDAPAPLGVLPLTFCAELACEAATRLLECDHPLAVVELRNIRGHAWLAVDDGQLELEIRARRNALGQVDVGIATIDHPEHPAFTATVIIDPAGRPPAPAHAPEPDASARLQQCWRPEDLYAYVLFHGPLLHSIRRVVELRERSLIAELVAPATDRLFADAPLGARPMLAIPASLLDGAGQLAGYHALHGPGRSYFGLFPYAIEQLRLLGDPIADHERVRVHGRFEQSGLTLTANFQFVDREGRLRAEIEGMQHRRFEWSEGLFSAFYQASDGVRLSHAAPCPIRGLTLRWLDARTIEVLSEGSSIFARALGHVALDPTEREAWRALPLRERLAWLLERVLLKELLALRPTVPLVSVPTLPHASQRVALAGQDRFVVGLSGSARDTAGLALALIESGANVDARREALLRASSAAFADAGFELDADAFVIEGTPDWGATLQIHGGSRTAIACVAELEDSGATPAIVLVSVRPT